MITQHNTMHHYLMNSRGLTAWNGIRYSNFQYTCTLFSDQDRQNHGGSTRWLILLAIVSVSDINCVSFMLARSYIIMLRRCTAQTSIKSLKNKYHILGSLVKYDLAYTNLLYITWCRKPKIFVMTLNLDDKYLVTKGQE